MMPYFFSDFGNTSTLSLIDKIELGRAYSSVIKGDCFTMENLRLYSEEVDRRRVQAERGWRGAELEKVRAVKEEEDTEKKLGILQSTCTGEWRHGSLRYLPSLPIQFICTVCTASCSLQSRNTLFTFCSLLYKLFNVTGSVD